MSACELSVKLLITLTLLTIIKHAVAQNEKQQRYTLAPVEIDAIRLKYIELETALWSFLNRTEQRNDTEFRLKKVYDNQFEFVNTYLKRHKFDSTRYDAILTEEQNRDQSYKWRLLKQNLYHIEFEFGLMTQLSAINGDINGNVIINVTSAVLKNSIFANFFRNIELLMVNQTMYYTAMIQAADHMCETQQSSQHFLYSMYTDIAFVEIKVHFLKQFSLMVQHIYGKVNFQRRARNMRTNFKTRIDHAKKFLHEILKRAERVIWRCDPSVYVKAISYDAVTRLLQGYVENEVNMNADRSCREDCQFYEMTRSEGSSSDLCTTQPPCAGNIHDCGFVKADMWVCLASHANPRRYEFIDYNNGPTYGRKTECSIPSSVESWRKYLFWQCSYCFCLCDEAGLKSDRYFNLRETLADVKNNKVITGLRFVKRKRVFHIQVQEGELLPRGAINSSNTAWKPLADYNIFDSDVRNRYDYHTLDYKSRSIDLDDIYSNDSAFVLTGIRFRLIGTHLNLEAHFSEIDFKRGIVLRKMGFWKSNDNTDISEKEPRTKLELQQPDVSTYTPVKSILNSHHNQYIDFVNTDKFKDAAQTTVPFMDIQDVVSNPPVPLSGVGIYHKGRQGYGGFIAPKIMTYDYTPHF